VGFKLGNVGSSIAKAVTSAAESTYSAASKGVVATSNAVSNEKVVTAMPLLGLYTGRGREALMNSPYAKLAAPLANLAIGPGAGAVVGSLVSGAGTPQETATADAGWGMNDLLASMLLGGGAAPQSSGSTPAASSGSAGIMPWIVGGVAALLAVVLLVVVIARGRK